MLTERVRIPLEQGSHARSRGRGAGPDWLRLAFMASPGLGRLHRLHAEIQEFDDAFATVRHLLERLEVGVNLSAADAAGIPPRGPLVITANHPFGALDGLVAIDTIGRVRQDLRVLANPELASVPAVGALIVPVDPFGGAAAARANVSGMRRALRWLEGGGVLLIFPAGEVSNLDLRTRQVTDREWSPTAARLVRLAAAPVTPMHIAGANSALFQLAGFVHPRLRTLLLPYELGNKVGSRVEVRIGEPLPPARYTGGTSDAELAAQLRLRTYAAGASPPEHAKNGPPRRQLALLLLWRGIGEYVGRHPEYCKLLGPVSISSDYSLLSRALLVRFLRQRNFDPLAHAMVRPRRPFRGHLSLRSPGGVQPDSLQTLSALLAGLEPDGKSTPVLLRQYLKLGGRVLGFNIDPEFGDSLDCLVLVDLRRADPRVLEKYMSEAAFESFRQMHLRRRRAGKVA